MRIIVVGAVAGGATALARLRRLDEFAEITVFEKGKYVSFANCGLPYYIGGVIPEREDLFVSTKESIEMKYNVDIRTEHEVVAIHRDQKTVEVKNLNTGEIRMEAYDKLLLSTGSRPFVPPIEGVDASNIFQLWTVPDTDKIKSFIQEKKPRKAVVIGGGFIGLEMAENLVEAGLEVTLVDLAKQVMPPFDEDMAKLVENHLVSKKINLMLGRGIERFEDGGKTVILSTGESVETDMVLLSIGVRPNSELARNAGLSITERGGIEVDENGKTSDEDIYAVGDVIGVKEFVSGEMTMIPLAGPANKQGRAVCANILGQMNEKYIGTMGTSVAKIFDITCATTGLSQKTLERMGKKYGKDYKFTIVHPMSNAGYYPGAKPMTIKLIFSTDGKILGAQIVGYAGVDKRIDTIAASIHFRGSVEDLLQLELAYAPPYSSAKDPVNFAGYVADNILKGLSDPLSFSDLMQKQDEYQVLDVREKWETESGMIPNAINIPLSQLRRRIGELNSEKEYVAYCAVGIRGYIAERILKQRGFSVKNLIGGYRTYNDLTVGEKSIPFTCNSCNTEQK